jgi:hypothetical protein
MSRNRSARVSRRPADFWPPLIIEAVRYFGGGASPGQVYDWVQENVALTDDELAASPHNERPYFVNTVRGIMNDMGEDGRLRHPGWGWFTLP